MGGLPDRLRRRGIASMLGPREADVMEIVWRMGPVTVADVHSPINRREPIAYTTVMTIMGRLVSKGILTRERKGGSYVYSAAISKEEMVQSLIRNTLDGLLREFAAPTVAYFMRRLAEDEDTLEEVERIIAQRKSQQ